MLRLYVERASSPLRLLTYQCATDLFKSQFVAIRKNHGLGTRPTKATRICRSSFVPEVIKAAIIYRGHLTHPAVRDDVTLSQEKCYRQFVEVAAVGKLFGEYFRDLLRRGIRSTNISRIETQSQLASQIQPA